MYGYLDVAQWLQTLKPFKYSIKIKNNKLVSNKINTESKESNKINTESKESQLFILYALEYKNYTSNLTPNLVTNIFNYI